MPRKKATRKKTTTSKTTDAVRRGRRKSAEEVQAEADSCPTDAVTKTLREQLSEARRTYENARQETVERLRQLREGPAGEGWDRLKETVRRHPGPSVIVALVLGIFLGRLFRR